MSIQLGVHLGQQNTSMDELRSLWRRLDDAGMDWISAWDHLYEAPPQGGDTDHFEAVATHAALAAETTNARVGSLVFCVPYRNPALLAKAAVAIDHISGGRFELGLGAGWHAPEFRAHGYDFDPVGTRFDMLEEGATIIKGMLNGDEDEFSFAGEHYRVDAVKTNPRPVNGHLPIWIGGRGPKRTPELAARIADGWNVAYVSPQMFTDLSSRVTAACERIDRDPATLQRTVNLSFNLTTSAEAERRERERFDAEWPDETRDAIREGALMGQPDAAIERILSYMEAGADGVNVAVRLPVDDEALDAYLETVVPAVRQQAP